MSIAEHIASYVEKVGGIDKVKEVLAAMRLLDKKNDCEMQTFLANLSQSTHGTRSLCAAALLGLSLAVYIYEMVPSTSTEQHLFEQ